VWYQSPIFSRTQNRRFAFNSIPRFIAMCKTTHCAAHNRVRSLCELMSAFCDAFGKACVAKKVHCCYWGVLLIFSIRTVKSRASNDCFFYCRGLQTTAREAISSERKYILLMQERKKIWHSRSIVDLVECNISQKITLRKMSDPRAVV